VSADNVRYFHFGGQQGPVSSKALRTVLGILIGRNKGAICSSYGDEVAHTRTDLGRDCFRRPKQAKVDGLFNG
jgi:hypothetical protein